MQAISAIGIFSSIVYALLIFNKKQKSYSDKVLIVWMMLFSIHLLLPFMMAIGNRFFIEKIDGLDIGMYTLHVTFLYYYSLCVINNKSKFKLKEITLLIPVAFIYFIQNRIDNNTHLFDEIIKAHFFNDKVLFHLTGVVWWNLIFCIYFCNKFFRLLHKHHKNIRAFFSYSENIDLRWLKNMNISALALTFIVVLFLIGLLNDQLNHEWVNNLYFSLISIFVVVLGYLGFKQGVILTDQSLGSTKTTQKKEKQTKTIPKGQADKEENIEALLQFMKTQKPYLEPQLNIGTIANSLGIHGHQLSKLINQHFNQNFFDFINNYRVEEFKRLAADPKNKNFSILGLALDSGFNSKATFNRIFKNKTGQTPSQYRSNFSFQ